MPSMLEQAIIDANALREAAMQTAESAIIEKYSFEVKEAVEKWSFCKPNSVDAWRDNKKCCNW